MREETRSVKDKPFYQESSVGAIPFQGDVFYWCHSVSKTPLCRMEGRSSQLNPSRSVQSGGILSANDPMETLVQRSSLL